MLFRSVAVGANESIDGVFESAPPYIHGDNGIGNVRLPESKQKGRALYPRYGIQQNLSQSEIAIFDTHVDTVQVIEDILFLKNSYHFTQPVKLSADYVYTDGQLSMEGFFETSIEVECSRCLQLFEYPLHIDFQEVFFQEENADFDDEVYTFEDDKLGLDRKIGRAHV